MKAAFLVLAACLASGAQAGEGDIAITGATVHTVSDAGAIEDAVLLIRNGRIEAVGAGLAVPAGYERVDATGRSITPGLMESYSQLSLVEIPGEATTVDAMISDYPSGASFDVSHALNPDSVALAVNRRDGLTRAVVAPMPGNDPFAGWGAVIRLGGAELLTAAEVGLFGAIGSGSAGFVGGSRAAVIQRLRRGLAEAPAYRADRYRPGPGDFSHQDMAALKRFRSGRAPLVLTVHRAGEIREAVALAREFDRRLVIVGGSEAWKVADLLAARVVPVVVEVLANLPSSYERLGARLDNAALLHAAGVPVLLTGGGSQNARLIRQMAGNAVAHGLPWEAALAAMTRTPAEVWDLPAGTGTIAPDAPAELVIWSGDPLELTTWAERVMIEGEWQDMTSRQSLLFERYRDPAAADRAYR